MKKIKKFFSRLSIWFKKWSWLIAFILVGLVLVLLSILAWILTGGKAGKKEDTPPLPVKTLLEIKDRINETNMKAAIEITAAKTEDEKVQEELKDISKIKEKKERIDKLIDLYNRMNLDA